jgi:hypothetical protein
MSVCGLATLTDLVLPIIWEGQPLLAGDRSYSFPLTVMNAPLPVERRKME